MGVCQTSVWLSVQYFVYMLCLRWYPPWYQYVINSDICLLQAPDLLWETRFIELGKRLNERQGNVIKTVDVQAIRR